MAACSADVEPRPTQARVASQSNSDVKSAATMWAPTASLALTEAKTPTELASTCPASTGHGKQTVHACIDHRDYLWARAHCDHERRPQCPQRYVPPRCWWPRHQCPGPLSRRAADQGLSPPRLPLRSLAALDLQLTAVRWQETRHWECHHHLERLHP
jgi:hypothetical protein